MPQSKSSPKPEKKGFDKSRRIRKKSDFQRIRKTSSKWVARHWVLFYSKNDVGHPRLAVTISARYGNAVERNWYRRWLREKFRLEQKNIKSLDLHFIAKQKPTSIDKKRYKEELHEDFQRLLHRFA